MRFLALSWLFVLAASGQQYDLVIQGGRVIGSSDAKGAYPQADPHKPENMAATIYQSLGLPETAAWLDEVDRPHHIYHANPIRGLFA